MNTPSLNETATLWLRTQIAYTHSSCMRYFSLSRCAPRQNLTLPALCRRALGSTIRAPFIHGQQVRTGRMQHVGKRIGRQRFAVIKTLRQRAAVRLKKIDLLRGFPAYGQDFQMQAVGHRDDGLDQGGIVRIVPYAADE